MENQTMLQEILKAFKSHGEHINEMFDQMISRMDNFKTKMDNLESRL